VTAERVIRLVPSLIMSETEADELATGLAQVIRGFLGA